MYWRAFLSTCLRGSLYETSQTREGRGPTRPNETSACLQILSWYSMENVPLSLIDLMRQRISGSCMVAKVDNSAIRFSM